MKIAVITTNGADFEKYYRTQSKEVKVKLQRVSVLRDLKEEKYEKSIMLVDSKNVTDKVIRDTLSRSLELEDLSQEFYSYAK